MKKFFNNGFSFIETIIGVAIFAIIAFSIYQSYISIFTAIRNARVKTIAAALANEQFEIMRNLPYSDVGLTTLGGGLHGVIPQYKDDVIRSGISFKITTSIHGIDDPFDGVIGGTAPNKDQSYAADYKLAQVQIDCLACKNFQPLIMSTHIAPKNIEATSHNGAIILQVFDANGQPVPNANVHIFDDQASPLIDFYDKTDTNGVFRLYDTPPSTGLDYEITVSKDGYTTDKTYEPGDPANNNPDIPHTNIRLLQDDLAQAALSIDKVSTVNVSSVFNNCSSAGNANFSIEGTKSIGSNTLKYPLHNFTTDSGGTYTINNMEWDTYNMSIDDSAYDFIGSIPLSPFILSPNTTQNIKLIAAPKNPRTLLVTVTENGTNPPTPITDASVVLSKTSAGYSNIQTTGRGTVTQSDWSGGYGQEMFTVQNKYFDSDGNIDHTGTPGEIKLVKFSESYISSGTTTSSTFDTGDMDHTGNFYQISWQPQNQPAETGTDSVKFQIAVSDDQNGPWNFTGPNGVADTFYTSTEPNMNLPINNGHRYFRYRAFLHTDNTDFTPILSDISFTFTAGCVPPGQVFFNGLSQPSYKLTVSKTNYQTVEDENISTNDPWQQVNIHLTPQ